MPPTVRGARSAGQARPTTSGRPPAWRLLLWVPLLAFVLFSLSGPSGVDRTELSLDRVEALIAEGAVVEAVIESDADLIRGTLEPGILPEDAVEFEASYADGFEGELTERLIAADVTTTIERSGTSPLSIILGLRIHRGVISRAR